MKKLLILLLGFVVIATPIWSQQRGAILFYQNNIAFVDGKAVLMPEPATVVDGQVMVPLDFMAAFTNSKVSYENGFIWVQHIEREKPKVYFNEEAEKPLINLIGNAKNSIDIQMYSFTYEDVISALLAAAKKPNMTIRLLLRDTTQNRNYSQPLSDLKLSQTQVLFKPAPKKYLHRKLAVFDKHTVWIGSTNWSDDGFNHNAEVDISSNDPELASDVLEQIDADWKAALNINNGTPPPPEPSPPVQDAKFIGNKSSMVYHKPNCSYVARMDPENVDPLKSIQEAESKGYTPCSKCKPNE